MPRDDRYKGLTKQEIVDYVNWLVAEYMDKNDFRRTALFKEIETAYLSFPDIEELAENYSSCFVLLKGNESGKRGKTSCKTMLQIHQKFPNNLQIAEDFSYLLASCSYNFTSDECKQALSIAQTIRAKYPDNEDIKEHVIDIQNNYNSSLEYEQLSFRVKILRQDTQSQEKISEYINTLAKYARYIDDDELKETKSIIGSYCKKFPDCTDYKEKYASVIALLISSEEIDEKEAFGLLSEIHELFSSISSNKLLIAYVDSISNFLFVHNSSCRSCLEEITSLYERFSSVPQVVTAFAQSLYAIAQDSTNVHSAKKTLIKLFSLAATHPDNSDVQKYLHNAKWNFATDYKDAIFWDT